MPMMRFFRELYYPAAAGNVAWALCYLAVEKGLLTPGVCPRLALLALIFGYLVGEWLRLPVGDPPSRCYWMADGLLLLAIVVLAIATQQDKEKDRLDCYLAVVIGVTVAGHFFGCWIRSGEDWWSGPFLRAVMAAVGLPVLLLLPWKAESPDPWNLPLAVVVVLILQYLLHPFLQSRIRRPPAKR